MNAIFKSVYFLALITIFFGSLGAQQTGEIRGKVTDQEFEALAGVAIVAKSPSLQGLRTAVSDKNGFFRLPLLPVGTYSLIFELPGFEKLMLEGQEIHLGFTASLAVILKAATLKEEVTVKAPNPLIDKTKSDTSYRLKGDELARIPTQTRTIAELVGFTPGVTGVRVNTVTGGANVAYGAETGLPSFRGEGDAGNNWFVDGLSLKGVYGNDPGVRINYDAWDEVQIVSDGFAPEMGQALGGFINIVTKSGGNEFHGELGSLIRDKNLRSQRQGQLSAASLPDTSAQQYFGNLGGPILKDRLWFFVSDNFFGNVDQTNEQTVGWLTIPSGLRRVKTNNVFGKITYAPHKNHTVSLSGTSDKFLDQTGGIGLPEMYTKTDYTDYSYRLNYRGILSENTLLTAAFGQNRIMRDVGPLNDDYGPPSYSWQDIAQTTNNIDFGSRSKEWRSDLMVDLSQYLDLGRWGRHEIKAGWSYYDNGYESTWHHSGAEADPWKGNGFDDGVYITWRAPGIPLAIQEWGKVENRDSTKGIGFYAQDNFALGRFSFAVGLRTDTQQVFNDVGKKLWSWGLGDFMQPRASLAVDLAGDGRSVLKFGYGRFAMPIFIQSLPFMNQGQLSGYSYRNYNWVGPDQPTESQLRDPENWLFVFEQSGTAIPEQVAEGLKPNKATKFLLEFDRQLGSHWAVKLRGISSRAKNLLDDVGIYDPEVPSGLRYIISNFALKRRDYRALEIELNGRIADRFVLNASYTRSQAKGTYSGNMFEAAVYAVNFGSFYDVGPFGDHPFVPEGAPNKEFYDSYFAGLGGNGVGDEGWYGFLPYSVDHIFKILCVYLAPYGFNVSSNIEYLSGYHWEKKGWSPGYGSFWTFPEGRGTRTTPAHMYVDLSIEKEIYLKAGLALGLGINVYNLMNSQRPVSYIKEDTELFGQVWARQLPRWVQLKATMRF
jgi:hypothetical protein